MTEQVENPIIKQPVAPDYREWPFLPCRSKALTFREFIQEEFSLDDLLSDSQIMEFLKPKYHDDYLNWLEEIN